MLNIFTQVEVEGTQNTALLIFVFKIVPKKNEKKHIKILIT